MAVVIDGTTGISTPAEAVAGNLSYTGTLTGNGGIVNLGFGQVYKDASGNVGIGTSSPASKLEVSGSGTLELARFATTTDNTPSIGIYSNGSIRGKLRASSAETALLSQGATPLLLGTNDTERARITSTGLFRNHSSEGVFRVNTSQGAGTTYELFWGGYGGSSTTAEGTNSIKIFSNGNIQNTNNSYGSLSDAKLKENIVDASPKLDKLNQVRIVNYNLKINPEQKLIGVVAQELEQLFPSMIDETPDRDEEGNELGTTTKAVKYSVFVPMLIKAIQEQQTLITQQAAALTALTTRITALEGTAA